MAKRKAKTKNEPEIGLPIEQIEGGGFDPDRVRILIYGESGAGKTRFASTWPNPFYLDLDDGLASVTRPVHRVLVSDWDQVYEIYVMLAGGEHEFQTIVVDSVNEAQLLGLRHTVDAYPNVRRAYDSLASQSDYGKMLSDVDQMIRALKSLPYNLVVIAQVTAKGFETDSIGPQLIGKHSARNIARMMDVVGYLYRDNNVPVMGFGLTDYISKDRSGRLPTQVEKVSYRKLARYWNVSH